MSRTRRPLRALAALAVGAATVVPLVGASVSTASAAAPATALDCPSGTVERSKTAGERRVERQNADPAFVSLLATLDDATADRLTSCVPVKAPEKPFELNQIAKERNLVSAGPMGYTPPGALRAAMRVQANATQAASTVPGAQGSFTALGKTPLITDDPDYPSVAGGGTADVAGRVDSLVYDPVNRRVFAAFGTGGVWMSTDLGASWRSVSETLPYQSVGSIAWSPDGPAGHGTLLVNSGEANAGGNVHTGIGAFRSTDSGRTWSRASGIPDGLMGFGIEVDPTNPKEVYAATSQGLYRSTDTGRTYVNVKLPTGDCAGKTGYDNVCMNANWVTDVEIQAPGGTTDVAGGTVIAAVGYRAGQLPYPGTDTPQSPMNGLYRSETGAPGSFDFLDVYAPDDASPSGFTSRPRIGRVEFGSAQGPEQDHGYLYAIVQDAVLFNGGTHTIDAFDPTLATGPVPNNTMLNGIYVSPDFGSSWTRMADELELQLPVTESALIGYAQTAGLYAPGVQGYYNMWIKPDPTTASGGVPTRLTFGLEEVWETRLVGTPQGATEAANPASFRVIGPYAADETCLFLNLGLPYCPASNTTLDSTTTHADQQSGLYVPKADGGFAFIVGNDGGVYRQDVPAGGAIDKNAWGRGAQKGLENTLLPYDASIAKDGTVWYGLQDNGSGKIEPNGRQVQAYGGDGFFAAVDPDDSQIAYSEYTAADMRSTSDGGRTWNGMAPPVTAPLFSNPFVMDPTDAEHLMTGGPEIVETVSGATTGTGGWVEVFNLDSGDKTGRQMTAVELHDKAAYVGFCSTCDIINKNPAEGQVFESGIATNVGPEAYDKATPDGWHFAAARGLPDRYVTSIAVDPTSPRTIYVTLGGYAGREWWPEGSFNDKNPNVGTGHVFKSTDAGESFTNISGSLPDVPARWVEVNRGQLLVGTDIGVFLSNNTAGQRWAALAGLPKVPVSTIRNHPGDPNKVVVATFGRGVYSYTFSARAGASSPVAGPAPAVRPARGALPATGLGATAAAVGLLALLGGLAVRRRVAA